MWVGVRTIDSKNALYHVVGIVIEVQIKWEFGRVELPVVTQIKQVFGGSDI